MNNTNRNSMPIHQDSGEKHRTILQNIAQSAMIERDLLPEFSTQALDQLAKIESAPPKADKSCVDLRHLLWCSVDNDDSRDLDQLTVAHAESQNLVKILVAIADVDSLVKKGSPIDDHAKVNTTSVYTSAEMFPMLPLKLSTELTSLNPNEDRMAIVIEMGINAEGGIESSAIYPALVRNHAKLAYNSVAAWLEDAGPMPEAIAKIDHLSANILLQDRMAQLMRKKRHEHGALDLETIQAKPVFHEDTIQDLEVDLKNRAKELIEDIMVAANTVSARFLRSEGFASFRRVVRRPERWDRIVKEASKYNYDLPSTASSQALAHFLSKQKAIDPLRFPDLSLTIIKLMGKGEYVVEFPHEKDIGHFGLAVMDYTHSTAPNRRFPDLVTQRMLKAVLKKEDPVYRDDELIQLAMHCTKQEDAATKVERRVAKSAGALLLSSRIGETFDGLCTGAADKGTWVRIFHPPIEGRLQNPPAGVDVGSRLRVELIHTDVAKGYIDFKIA